MLMVTLKAKIRKKDKYLNWFRLCQVSSSIAKFLANVKYFLFCAAFLKMISVESLSALNMCQCHSDNL